MFANLALAALMAIVCVLLHFVGLTLISGYARRHFGRYHARHDLRPQAFVILVTVAAIFAVHTVEIWAYGAAFLLVDPALSLADALYFSIETYTTLGYGDVLLSPDWHLFGATEAMVGLLLIGWSTAYLVAVSGRLHAFAEQNAEE